MEDVGNRDAPVSKYLNYVVINPLSFMQKLLQDTNLTHMEDFCQFYCFSKEKLKHFEKSFEDAQALNLELGKQLRETQLQLEAVRKR